MESNCKCNDKDEQICNLKQQLDNQIIKCKEQDEETQKLKTRLISANSKLMEHSLMYNSQEINIDDEVNQDSPLFIENKEKDENKIETLENYVKQLEARYNQALTEIQVKLKDLGTINNNADGKLINQLHCVSKKLVKDTNQHEFDTTETSTHGKSNRNPSNNEENFHIVRNTGTCQDQKIVVVDTNIERDRYDPRIQKGKQYTNMTNALQKSDETPKTQETQKNGEVTNSRKKIIGQSKEKGAFSTQKRKWIYVDRFDKSFRCTEMRELLFRKYNTYDFIIDEFIKKDFETREEYAAFKIGFSHNTDEIDIFDPNRWPENISVRFFREYGKKHKKTFSPRSKYYRKK